MSVMDDMKAQGKWPHTDESRARAELGVAALLEHLGYDPTNEGLADTPARVVRAFEELTSGEFEDAKRHLARTFDAEGTDNDEVIVVTGIDYVAMCEHHMLPFPGKAAVGYKPKPGAPVVGLSKIGRLVDVYARRLTMQERITRQITTALDRYLDADGSACVLRSTHSCMGIRGVKKPAAAMVTSSMTGLFREDARARDEFLRLANS